MKAIDNPIHLIGNTPLLNLTNLSDYKHNLFAKLEYLNPGGSSKDRAALQIIQDAYASGKLQTGQTVVEMTSGNMGAGLAFVCKHFGNPFIAVMPKGNSPERHRILKAFGAEIVLTEQVDGKPGEVTGKDIEYASSVASELAKAQNGFYVDQFNNSSCILGHYKHTGPEIFEALQDVTAFISTIGTGGTFLGISKYLKSKNKHIKCIAVEPEDAAILKTGKVINPKHIIQGTGYGVIPPHWEKELADDIITVSNAEVEAMTKHLSHREGVYVGYSSGANVAAALHYLNKQANGMNEKAVTLLCDSGYKYNDL